VLQEVEAPRFQDNRHMTVVRVSALGTGRLYPPGNIPGPHLCRRLSRPRAIVRPEVLSMKNSTDTIGYRIRDFPAFRAVPQTTAPSCAPITTHIDYNITVWTTMAYYRALSSVFTGAAREY
jgi:hypothetical protein